MPSITLKSHYDGRSILLDEPYELPTNAQTPVTVAAPVPGVDQKQWTSWGTRALRALMAIISRNTAPTT